MATIDPNNITQSGFYDNTSSNIVQVTEDKLIIYLTEFKNCFSFYFYWSTPLGISISILLCLLTADFKKFYLSGVSWRNIFISAFIISLIWLLISVIKSIKNHNKVNISALLNRIKNI
jgi:hypothetical protein